MNVDEKRDWANLLPDLVQVVASKVTEIFSFIRFRAVCKTWRFVTTIADLSPQFPWILCNHRGPDLLFYSIALDKYFTIHAPKFANKNYFEPCFGYMPVRSKDPISQISLVNPLTNNEISLPPLNCYFNEWIGSRNFKSGDYVVFKSPHTSIRACKPGDKRWVYQQITDNCYYLVSHNLLFMIDNALDRFTKVIDIKTRKTIYIVPPPQDSSILLLRNSYKVPHPILVESFGEVLNITYMDELKKFEIYRFEAGTGNGNPHWVKVTSIGNRVLFIDITKYYGHCISGATDFRGLNLKGNCIYFIRVVTILRRICYLRVIERYDIESGAIKRIRCPMYGEFTWYFQSLNRI